MLPTTALNRPAGVASLDYNRVAVTLTDIGGSARPGQPPDDDPENE